MIAIGGAIGTGLFFASGGAIAQAARAGAMLAYAVMGLAVYCMMQSLGEMATQLPIPGSFEAYAGTVHRPVAGLCGGLELLVQAGPSPWPRSWSPAPSSCSSGSRIRTPPTGPWVSFPCCWRLNLLSVKAYAEAEYWFAGIKVVTVIIFLAVGALMIAGMLGDQHVGFQNWTLSDPKTGTRAPFVGGLTAVLTVFLVAGFSFQGTKASASRPRRPPIRARTSPRRSGPCSGGSLLFYIGSIFVVGTLNRLHRPEPASWRRGPHRVLALHHGVPAAAEIRVLRRQPHECRDPVLGAVLREFVDVTWPRGCCTPCPTAARRRRCSARSTGAGCRSQRFVRPG